MSFDWPDRPKASPTGGFLIQSRAGSNGNFEVVIPWPGGGLAHFWRDNDQEPRFPWHGPTVFGEGRYRGATVAEGFNKAFKDPGFGNLEVLAVRETGEIEHWWRENGGHFVWRLAGVATRSAVGVPAMAFTGAAFKPGALDQDVSGHLASQFWAAAPSASGGFHFLSHQNDPVTSPPWRDRKGLRPDEQFPNVLRDRQFVGVGLALTCLESRLAEAWSWKEMQESSRLEVEIAAILVAATSDAGALTIFRWNEDDLLGTPVGTRAWSGAVTVTVPIAPNTHELRSFRGRPALLQSDDAVDEETSLNPFESNHYGNLELLCAAKQGGIHHLWRDNGGNDGDGPRNWEEGWSYAGRIGDKIYDEVAVIQSNFGTGDHGNLEMIARAADQPGFDFYFRDEAFRWHGPHTISGDPAIGSTAQPLTLADPFAVMIAMGIDFSVTESDLRSWMADPVNTPYPAITAALFVLFAGRRLRRPIFIDVIAFNYETAPGVTSPRSSADVSRPLLERAIIEGHNNRYGEAVGDVQSLLT